jgi:hypothetical protein
VAEIAFPFSRQYAAPASSAPTAAYCDTTGGQIRIVSWILAIASPRRSGTTMYPMRQLAKPYAFEKEKREMVCSSLPGMEAGEWWRASP